MHRHLSILGGTALVAAVGLSSACSSTGRAADPGPSAPATVVAAAQVARRDLAREWVLAADFQPYQEIDVHAKVSGFVKSIYVDVGDRVRAGQLLAVLEVPELVAEVSQADAARKHAEAEIARAQGELSRSESAHAAVHGAYSRLAEVIKARPNLVAQQDIDDALGRDRVGEAQIAAAQGALSAAREQLQVAKASQEKVQTLLAYARITAPFSGVVTKRYADNGALIQAGTASQTQTMPVIRLAQSDLLRLTIPIPESVIPSIHVGTPVQVIAPALGRTVEGKISRFSSELDASTRTMHTEVDVPNPKLEIVPGMYASANLSLEKRARVLTVPVQAINRSGEKASVLLIDSGHRLEQRTVKLGLESPNDVEIVSGLKEGDLVVVGNTSLYKPGQLVEPKLAAAAARGDN